MSRRSSNARQLAAEGMLGRTSNAWRTANMALDSCRGLHSDGNVVEPISVLLATEFRSEA